jgi:hypothetical protein
MDQAKNVTATFTQTTTGGGGGVGGQPTVLTTGTFRDGSWYYDKNGNSRWEGCANDTCFTFGQSGDQPVTGVWIAGTKKRIGVFRQGAWYLDRNGSQGWDGCSGGDACLSFGALGDVEREIAVRLLALLVISPSLGIGMVIVKPTLVSSVMDSGSLI